MNESRWRGFTLLEMTLVLLLLGIIMGGLMQPLLNNRQQLLAQQAKLQLEEIHNSLLGYAVSKGRLPCPASATSGGEAMSGTSGCSAYGGFVPYIELGVSGALDGDGVLLDPWSKRIVYRLSSTDSDEDGSADFAVTNGMRAAGLPRLSGDLEIMHWVGGNCDALQRRASHVVAVIYTDAQHEFDSRAERLNRQGSTRFSTGVFSHASDCGYDDQLRWISDSALFTQMLRAHQLP